MKVNSEKSDDQVSGFALSTLLIAYLKRKMLFSEKVEGVSKYLNNKICKTLLTIIIVFTNSLCYAQKKHKPDLYLYFDSSQENRMVKQRLTQTREINGKEQEFGYDIYRFYLSVKPKRTLGLMTEANSQDRYTDKSFADKYAKRIDDVKDIPGIGYDTSDYKRFPFKNVYILERDSLNRFSVRKVRSYIGTYMP